MMLPADIINDTSSSLMLQQETCQRFTLADIHSATHNFDETLVIGRGGFGKVYKCCSKILSVNEVAVKRLHYMSNQGANEFEAEVKVLSNLRHGNLVSLIGYCNEGNEIILVYEFMPNGTLEDHLHKGDTDLSWLQRLNICIGVARGLDYLHTGTSTQRGVIHRDVKSSNILLDTNFAAKISDFGLAKICPINQTISFVNTRVKGTFGYIDPCYFFSGNLTRKSDVYAFGVVLFEVLSGKQAVDQTIDEEQWSLAVWAQDQIKEGKLNQIIDSRLIGQISKKCLKEFTSIACHCLHSQPKRRPTMAEVVVKLVSILLQERERADSGVHEVRLINKVRHFFSGQSDLMPGPAHNIQKSENQSLRKYTYAELVSATNNFDIKEFSTNLLENVYKGWVDGRTYAPTESGVGVRMYVRKMCIGSGKLDLKPEEFNHPNLVKLFGYCLNDGEFDGFSYPTELSCVYELTPDTSLDKLLFTEPGKTSLPWVARLKIALGAARGLSFLHQRKHPAYSQFKTTCILVDTEYNARLRDFEVEESFVDYGSYAFDMDAPYAAPEWFRFRADIFDGIGILGPHYGFGVNSVKSEIYAFGLVLVEVLTGMNVYEVGKQNLARWATVPTDILLADNVNSGMISDPQHQYDSHASKEGLLELAQLVSNCLRPQQEERPSMEEIVQVLCQCYEKETKIPVTKEPEV